MTGEVKIYAGAEEESGEWYTVLYIHPCYGYKKYKKGILVIDDEQAKVVRNIFNWYSIVGIIKKLETNGIKPPKGNDRCSKKGIEST